MLCVILQSPTCCVMMWKSYVCYVMIHIKEFCMLCDMSKLGALPSPLVSCSGFLQVFQVLAAQIIRNFEGSRQKGGLGEGD
jgi:hypothetical protein